MPIQFTEGFYTWAKRLQNGGYVEAVYKIDFFVNDYTPDINSSVTDFTWLTLNPWLPVALTDLGMGEPSQQADGSELMVGGLIYAALDSYSGTNIVLYGWVLRDTANGVVVEGERFATPYTLPKASPVVVCSPRVQVGQYAP